jgi:hypothetical protein
MDHVSPGPLFHKPQSIVAAKNILYAVLFLMLITWAISQWTTDLHTVAPAQSIAILILTVGITFTLIKCIGLGKKWARVVMLVLFIAGLAAFPWTVIALFKVSIVVAVLSLLEVILQLIALAYLFSRESTLWFDRVHEKNRDEPAR